MNIELHLPRLHPGQQYIRSHAKRFNVLRCGRRFGKSDLSKDLLIETALDKGLPAAYYAPTYKMLATFWAEFKTMMLPIIASKDEQLKTIRLISGGVVDFWSLQDDNVSRGRKYKRVIVDEAAMVDNLEAAWTQAIRPTLTDYKGDAWFMSTPKGLQSYFYKLSQNHTRLADWTEFHFPTVANPHIDPLEVEAAKLDLDALIFQQEYLAEFVELEGNPFFHNWSTERNVQATAYNSESPIYLSFDFNVKNTCLVFQLDYMEKTVWFLEEYQQGGVGMDLEMLCRDIVWKYPESFLIVTGDASGNNRSALTTENATAYDLIDQYLRQHGAVHISYQVPPANPKTANVRFVVNAILKHCKIYSNPSMTITHGDLMRMRTRADGGLDKAHADKFDYAHAGDCYRYALFNICYDWYSR